jgi:hypothetical protein
VTLNEVFLALKGVIVATLTMAIGIFLFNSFSNLSLLIGFIVKIAIGFIIYFSVLVFLEKELLINLRKKLNF